MPRMKNRSEMQRRMDMGVEGMRSEVEQIIDRWALSLDTPTDVAACADDVCAYLLGWPVRYPPNRTAPDVNLACGFCRSLPCQCSKKITP